MPTSNALFLEIVDMPQLEAVGWTVRVLDGREKSVNFLQPIAYISEFHSLMIGPEMNAPGAGSVAMSEESPFWSTTLLNGEAAIKILDYEHIWECYEDGVLRFQFLGRKVVEALLDDNETQGVTVSGPGIAEHLKKAVVMPNYFPPASNGAGIIGTTAWTEYPVTWSAMRVWLDLLDRAQMRGSLTYVQRMFTYWVDSGGAPWDVLQIIEGSGDDATLLTKISMADKGGTSLLDMLNIHTGQDLNAHFAMRAEWYMHPGFKLDVRKVIGTHRESKVVFYEGMILEKTRERDRADIANYIVSTDNMGRSSFAVDYGSISKWGQREAIPTQDNVRDPARQQAVTNLYLAQLKEEHSQWTIRVPYDFEGRRIFRDFGLGDWIGVSVFLPSKATEIEAYRVMAFVVNVKEDGEAELELTLQTNRDAYLRELQKQMTALLHQVKVVGTTPPSTTTFPPGGGVWVTDPDTGDTSIWEPPGGEDGEEPPIFEGGGGVQVFIQEEDPGEAANLGDFWLQIYTGD